MPYVVFPRMTRANRKKDTPSVDFLLYCGEKLEDRRGSEMNKNVFYLTGIEDVYTDTTHFPPG